MNAFIRFNKGILRLPIGVQIWLVVLIAANLVVPLSYLDRVEAQVVLATSQSGGLGLFGALDLTA